MSNTELIGCVQHDCAKCKAVQDEVYLRNGDVLRLMKEREALQAEVERLTLERDVNKRMRDQHFAEVERLKRGESMNEWVALLTENGELRTQLAAAQGQEPIGFVESAVRGAGGFHARFSSGVFIPAGTPLFATPVPQQPAAAQKMATPYITQEQFDRVFPDAPQPKETK